MKKISALLLVTVLMLTFLSCKKSSDDTNIGNGTMSAKVDGTAWSATLAVQGTLSTGSPQVLALGGTGSLGQINLTIGNYTGPATYTIGIANPATSAIFTLTSSPFTSHSATAVLGTGTITVTSQSGGFVEGTFSFSGKNGSGATITSKEITEGTFKVKI